LMFFSLTSISHAGYGPYRCNEANYWTACPSECNAWTRTMVYECTSTLAAPDQCQGGHYAIGDMCLVACSTPKACACTNKTVSMGSNHCPSFSTNDAYMRCYILGKCGTGGWFYYSTPALYWDATERKCIECSGQKEYKIYGASGYLCCGSGNNCPGGNNDPCTTGNYGCPNAVSGNNVFERACGASLECDEKGQGAACGSGGTCDASGNCIVVSCSGTASLSLSPSSGPSGTTITFTGSGLSGCNGKTFYFNRKSSPGVPDHGNCGASPSVANCPISGSGCSALFSESGPYGAGTYTYVSCTDKNGDGDWADAGEQSSPKSFTLTAGTYSYTVAVSGLNNAYTRLYRDGGDVGCLSSTGTGGCSQSNTWSGLSGSHTASVQTSVTYGSVTCNIVGSSSVSFSSAGSYTFSYSCSVAGTTCEYNNNPNIGSISFSPNPVTQGYSTTANTSGWGSGCYGWTFYVRTPGCTGSYSQKCSSTINSAGSGSCSFTATDSPGTYQYQSCIDRNNNGNTADFGEQSWAGSLTINPPACSNDCSPSGTKMCSGNNVYQCSNCDADSCLEWCFSQNCDASDSYICSGTNRCVASYGDTRYYRDYYCSGGNCLYSDSWLGDCGCSASDTDWGQDVYTTGTCTDYTGCSGGNCGSSSYTDTCSGTSVREYYVSGSGDSATCTYTDLSCPNGYACSGGSCIFTCYNDCSPSGAKMCSGNNVYQCSNCDADSCLEWCFSQNCDTSDAYLCSGTNRCGTSSGDTWYYKDYYCSGGNCLYSDSWLGDCDCTAYDSDYGQDVYTAGTCTDYTGCSGTSCSSSSYTDTCSGTSVREYYVSGSGNSATCTYTDLSCPSGYTCSGGKCIFVCYEDCSPSGTKMCSGNNIYQCSNCDADSCLEWCFSQNCDASDAYLCSGTNRCGTSSGDTWYYKDYYCSGGSCTYSDSWLGDCDCSASDTDGGQNVYTAGICTDYTGCSGTSCSSSSSYADTCASGTSVREYYVSGSGNSATCTYTDLGCPSGYTCSGGRCVASTYTLTVTKSGTGSGTVTSSPAGISCGSDCSEAYNSGTSVTLTAAAASGSTFASWSGDCSGTGSCVLTMNSIKSVTATFNETGCNLNRTGDHTVNYPCVLEGAHHLVNGNLTITSGGYIQMNPNSSFAFDAGKKIIIEGTSYILKSAENTIIQQ